MSPNLKLLKGKLAEDREQLMLGDELSREPELGASVRRTIGRFGFLRIAQKIEQSLPLELDDVELLIARAGLPVLMQLQLLRPRVFRARTAIPLLLLSESLSKQLLTSTSAQDGIAEQLRSMSYPEIHIMFQTNAPAQLAEKVAPIIERLSKVRPGLTFLAPRLEDLIAAVCASRPISFAKGYDKQIETTLSQLRQVGFQVLNSARVRQELTLLGEMGFRTTVYTDLYDYLSTRELAEELLSVANLFQSSNSRRLTIEVWGAALRRYSYASLPEDAVRDFQLLRILAVGSLVLPLVPAIRASSRYFSLQALTLAQYCGANDLGYAALDEFTAAALNIESIKTIQEALE